MIRRLLVALFLFAFSFAHAETIKTDVLVIGGGPAGVAAAIQSARSKVKTFLVEPGAFLGGDIIKAGSTCVLDANRNLPSGIWGEFRRKITDHYSTRSGYDTTYNAILRFEPYDAAELLKRWTDTVKNLTVKMNTSCTNIKKDGTGWEVVIVTNGETVTIKTKVIVDATDNGGFTAKAGVKLKDRFDNHKDYGDKKIYRTSIATGEALPGEKYGDANGSPNNYPPYPSYCIPLNAILSTGADNLLIIDKALPENKTIQYFPVQMTLGQGVGATAAYCAFFKTTTQHLRVRIIQGGILDHKGYLLPFTDIPQKDPHFRAIQQVCATGLLKGVQKTTGIVAEIHFEPNDLVNTEEIRPILDEIYTRSFLWFNKEKPGTQFTLGNLLSLISDYTLTDPTTLKIYLQKAWTPQFKLTGTFDLNRPVTRLEFAVLTNRYLNPFAKTVDLSGRIVN
ncbi:MAG TPA: FAD-dependent oxidoreductase [Mucilaginibacter sp.]